MIEILNMKKDQRSLEKRISKLIKKNPDLSKMKELKQFHILYLGIDETATLTKEDYMNLSFLHHLHTDKNFLGTGGSFDIRVKCISTMVLVTDSKGYLVAFGDVLKLLSASPPHAYPSEVILAKMFFDKEIDFIFNIASPNRRYYEIGIKGNNLYVFSWDDAGFVIYPWEEFMECRFDDWINNIHPYKSECE